MSKTIKEDYLNSIRGCMIGGAVGDALGWPVEFKSEREIKNKYWPDGIKEYSLNSAGKAEITDATIQNGDMIYVLGKKIVAN